jgi:hypothetical protein
MSREDAREGPSVVSGDNRDSWAIFRAIRPSRADIIRRKIVSAGSKRSDRSLTSLFTPGYFRQASRLLAGAGAGASPLSAKVSSHDN